jgi:hypothetical protein
VSGNTFVLNYGTLYPSLLEMDALRSAGAPRRFMYNAHCPTGGRLRSDSELGI